MKIILSLFKRVIKRIIRLGERDQTISESEMIRARWNQPYVSWDPSSIFSASANMRFDVPRKDETKRISIGRDSVINCNFIFESSDGGLIEIGDRSYIGPGTNLISRNRITIGSDVVIAWGCYVYDHNSHSIDWMERRNDINQVRHDLIATGNQIFNKNWKTVSSKPIMICDRAWLGFECVIMKGVTIGEGAIVGARSVVRENVEPYTVVAGNPAVVIRKLNQ
jgi:galactoside O-acetyltransferase